MVLDIQITVIVIVNEIQTVAGVLLTHWIYLINPECCCLNSNRYSFVNNMNPKVIVFSNFHVWWFNQFRPWRSSIVFDNPSYVSEGKFQYSGLEILIQDSFIHELKKARPAYLDFVEFVIPHHYKWIEYTLIQSE